MADSKIPEAEVKGLEIERGHTVQEKYRQSCIGRGGNIFNVPRPRICGMEDRR